MNETARGPSIHIVWSGRLIVAFGTLMLLHWFVTSRRALPATLLDLVIAVGLFAASLGAQRGLRRRAPWAWWVALAIALVGLFFVAPVTGTILLGGGVEPVGTGWDVVFFPLTTALLIGLLIMLREARKEPGGRSSRPRRARSPW